MAKILRKQNDESKDFHNVAELQEARKEILAVANVFSIQGFVAKPIFL